LFSALKSPKKTLQIDAAGILFGITTGTSEHKELVVGNPDYLNQLFSIGINDPLEVILFRVFLGLTRDQGKKGGCKDLQ